MEGLYNSTLEAVAFASAAGLPVKELWNHLNDAAIALGTTSNSPILRKAIWKILTENSDHFCLQVPPSNNDSPPTPVSWDAPEASTYVTAEDADLVLVASAPIQDAAIGVYASRLHRFQISVPQRQTLQILGGAKHQGALQSVLSSALGIDPRNYSYVVKNLEERGLVAKAPTVLQNNKGSVTATNLIVLAKFAPSEMNDPSARYTDGKLAPFIQSSIPSTSQTDFGGLMDSALNPTAEDDDSDYDDFDEPTNANNNAEISGKLHIVNDDEIRMRRITAYLATKPDQTIREPLLKRELGYIKKVGHRRWRRLRGILEKKGCIERYKARAGQDGNIVIMVKLLQPWTSEGDDDWALSSLFDPVTGKLNIFGEQIAELTIDRQLLRMLAVAGSEGLTSADVDRALRMNIKRNEPRFKELRARFGDGIVEQHVNIGKSKVLRHTANAQVLAVLDTALQGLSSDGVEAPANGFEAAVRDAIQAGLNEDGTNPLLIKYKDAVEGDDADEGNGKEAIPKKPVGSASDDGIDEREDMEVGNDDAAPPPPAFIIDQRAPASEQQELPLGAKRRKAPLMEIARLRRQWLVDEINKEGLVLMSEMGSLLQEKDRVNRNNPNAVRPDKKVNQRIIDAAVEAGEIKVLHVTFPGVHGSHSARPHTVLAKPGTQQDSAFVDKVFNAYRKMLKRVRTMSTVAIHSARREDEGVQLPVVEAVPKREKSRRNNQSNGDLQTSADPAGNQAANEQIEGQETRDAHNTTINVDGDYIYRKMVENGLIPARMQRAWSFHHTLWDIIIARQGAASQYLAPNITAAAAQGKAFIVSNAPASIRSSRPLDMGLYTGSPEQQGFAFTTHEIWRSMTVDTLFKCLGSKAMDYDVVQHYKIHKNAKLGELKRRDLIALTGGIDALTTAKSNVTKLLDLLHRMGLISAIVPFGNVDTGNSENTHNKFESVGSSAFFIRSQVPVEEPYGHAGTKDQPERAVHVHTFDVSNFKERELYWMCLKFLIMCSPATGRGLRTRDDSGEEHAIPMTPLNECFPFNRASESWSERSWMLKVSYTPQQVQLASDRVTELLKSRPPPSPAAPDSLPSQKEGDIGDREGHKEGVITEGREGGQRRTTSASIPALITWNDARGIIEELDVPLEAIGRAVAKEQGTLISAAGLVGPRSRRLGNFGIRRPSKRTGGRQRSSRKRHRDEELSDDDFGDDEHGLEFGAEPGYNLRGLRLLAPPQRKRKWYVEEDRQLLRAWAKWLAANGPDKILRWKSLKDRPKEVLPLSCKNRIALLKKNITTSAMMLKVSELAAGVHSRRVLREAELGKSGVDIDDESHRASKKPRLNEPQTNTSTTTPLILPQLWTITDDQEASALDLVLKQIELIVAKAPNRHKKRRGELFKSDISARNREQVNALYQKFKRVPGSRHVLGGLGGRLLGPAARGPLPIARQFMAFKQWAEAVTHQKKKDLGELVSSTASSNPSISAAMELIKSLLLVIEEGQVNDEVDNAGPASKLSSALIDRFEPEVIKSAIASLTSLGHIQQPTVDQNNKDDSEGQQLHRGEEDKKKKASSGLTLSERFSAELQTLFLPSSVYSQALETEKNLIFRTQKTKCVPEAPLLSTRSGLTSRVLLPTTDSDLELNGGLMAVALSRMFLDSGKDVVSLNAFLPRSASLIPQLLGSNGSRAGDDERQREDSVANVLRGIKVIANIKLPTDTREIRKSAETVGTMYDSTQRVDVSPSLTILCSTRDDNQVLFQPSFVSLDAEIAKSAEKACKKLFKSKNIGQGAKTMEKLLNALQLAGPSGLERDDNAFRHCFENTFSPLTCREAVDALLRFGLARLVSAYDDVRLVSTNHRHHDHHVAQSVIAFPFSSNHMEIVLKSTVLAPQGSPQPCIDIPIRPWVDHLGKFRPKLWQALVQRAVATAFQYPGVPGNVLLQSMRVVNPQHAREVLSVLCTAGVLRAQYKRKEAAISRNNSVLAACFKPSNALPGHREGKESERRNASDIENPESYSKTFCFGSSSFLSSSSSSSSLSSSPSPSKADDSEWFFFADDIAWCNAIKVVPPQVLLSSSM